MCLAYINVVLGINPDNPMVIDVMNFADCFLNMHLIRLFCTFALIVHDNLIHTSVHLQQMRKEHGIIMTHSSFRLQMFVAGVVLIQVKMRRNTDKPTRKETVNVDESKMEATTSKPRKD